MSRRVLAKCFQEFKSSQRVIVPDICKLLITPPPEVTEEQFKVNILYTRYYYTYNTTV